MSTTPATVVRMPRKRKDPAEVSAMRAKIAREAWANLTPEERAARQRKTWAARPRPQALTRAQLWDIIQDTLGGALESGPTEWEMERLMDRLKAAGVAFTEEPQP